ncbi:MAG: fibrobacter succinogenes major paralogous domain-containing protein [Fibromonadales bacterium]|nr:fibrobacter succinogenes major paralogous domain-containing protein [Fibromonadales bacterium]
MNRIVSIPLTAIVIATSLAFFSCSSDSNDDEPGKQQGSTSETDPSSSSVAQTPSSSSEAQPSSSSEGASSSSEEVVAEILCGTIAYDPETHFCLDNGAVMGTETGSVTVTLKCGGKTYTASQFCSGTDVLNKCGGSVAYNPGAESCCGSNKLTTATQFCLGNAIASKCGGSTFTAEQFCYNNSKVGNKCGSRTETFDPDLYECKPEINSNGIFLKNPVSYGDESYEAVLIGTQTWMAQNLNYDADGSKCYNNSEPNCSTYGRLYNWATAMANSASSSANPSGVQGVCPAGWHIPSDAEWTALTTAVGSNPGAKLKAASGWNSSGNGTDDYGFSALPGGNGISSGLFNNVGYRGLWWSSTEGNASNAYYWGMIYNDSDVSRYDFSKTSLYSVRCVQD